jgi:hypothetical protein
MNNRDNGAAGKRARTANVADPDTLFYPRELQGAVGLSVNQINILKRRGCPFFGRKTTLRWVREFLSREAGAGALLERATLLPEHPRLQVANKCGEQFGSND